RGADIKCPEESALYKHIKRAVRIQRSERVKPKNGSKVAIWFEKDRTIKEVNSSNDNGREFRQPVFIRELDAKNGTFSSSPNETLIVYIVRPTGATESINFFVHINGIGNHCCLSAKAHYTCCYQSNFFNPLNQHK